MWFLTNLDIGSSFSWVVRSLRKGKIWVTNGFRVISIEGHLLTSALISHDLKSYFLSHPLSWKENKHSFVTKTIYLEMAFFIEGTYENIKWIFVFFLPLIADTPVEIEAHAGRECTAQTIVNTRKKVCREIKCTLSVALMSCVVWIQSYQCQEYTRHHLGKWITGISLCKLMVKYYYTYLWITIVWNNLSRYRQILEVALHGESYFSGILSSCHWSSQAWK